MPLRQAQVRPATQPIPRVTTAVSPPSRTVAWDRSRVLTSIFVVLLHALACVYFAGVAALHVYVRSEPKTTSMRNLVGTDVLTFFCSVIIASAAFAIVHGAAVVAIVGWRVAPRRVRTAVRDHLKHVTSVGPSPRTRPASRLRRVSTLLTHWDDALERRSGINSYELLVLVEIGLQTFQAYKLSHLVATVWINRLIVTVIVVNCWFMPLLSVVFRNKTPSFVKVVQLALDALLEIVYGMAIPFAIFYPYYRDAMAIFYDVPFLGFYKETWAINAVAENRQIYVTSWLDFCSKMAPGVSLFVRLITLQVQRNKHERSTTSMRFTKVAPHKQSSDDNHSSLAPAMMPMKKRAMNAILVAWGVAMLALHVFATSVSVSRSDPGCLLETRPLGATTYTCRVLEVSCTQKRITGTASELDNALSHVDASTVKGLVFSHCEALTMPPRLKTFPTLVMIKIHNCTIAEWSDNAALTAYERPQMQILYVTLTNMTAIPPGLLSPDFPPTLNDIEFCGTDLTMLPLDLFETWSMVDYFFLELSPGITEFPQALYRTNASILWLSLSSNAITELPSDLFAVHEYELFHVAGNPLTRLPAQVGSAPFTSRMSIAHTDIAALPVAWTAVDSLAQYDAAVKTSRCVLAADHTLLCSSAMAVPVNRDSIPTNVDARLSWLSLACAVNSARFYYPLEYEKQWRMANLE